MKTRNFFLWITACFGLLLIQSGCRLSEQKPSLIISQPASIDPFVSRSSDRFQELAEEYRLLYFSPDENNYLRSMIQRLSEELDYLDQISSFQDFPGILSKLRAILHKTRDLLVQPSPGSEIQKELNSFFNKVYELRFALHYIFAKKTVHKLYQAFHLKNKAEVLKLSQLLREVGTPDFQVPLWRLIKRARDEELHDSLLITLGKIGNQEASNSVFKSLLSSPRKIYLDALVDLGLPDFDNKKRTSQYAAKRYMKKGSAEKNLKRFYGQFNRFCKKMEGVFTALNLTEAEKQQYRLALIQSRGQDRGDFVFRYRGLTFREGDVVLTSGLEPDSRFWGSLTNFPVSFSHVQIVTFSEDGFPLLADLIHHIKLTHLEIALASTSDYSVLRFKDMDAEIRREINKVIQFYYKNRKRTKFDGNFDKSTDFLFYCSEFVYHVFNRAKIPVRWVYSEFPTEQARENIRKLGLKQSHFITQGDYLRMPDFSYIGCSYNSAIEAKITGGILVDIFMDHLKSDEMDFSKVPGKLWYRYLTKTSRLLSKGALKQLSGDLAYTMCAYFLSFQKIYNRARRRADTERLRLLRYSAFRRRMEEILHEESQKIIRSVFRPKSKPGRIEND